MQLLYELQKSWPPLAWLAECRPSESTVRVLHGPSVDARDDWFCEAVWDGPFESGDFDRTDLVFGSGGRIRGTRVVFVSSGTTVDRLHAMETGGVTRISNSLPCLLAAIGAGADPTYRHYIRDLHTVIDGLDKYRKTVPTTAGHVRLVYFHNLTWDGGTLAEVQKPNGDRRFRTFAEYRSFLSGSLGRCLANAAASGRAEPFRPLGTLSSGYDSPTVAALGREHGLREVISLSSARGGLTESTRPIAEILGLELALVSREAWRSRPLAEVPFLAADGRGEDVFFSGAEDLLRGRVLLTGFHGDKVWDKDTKAEALTPQIKRGDPSGLTLTEFRLWAGFIHLPVPFMGVRQIADIHAISNAPEMRPWHVQQPSKKYSRPICRRIVEGAGVPRGAFGVQKKAASVLFSGADLRFSAGTCADHRQWTRARRDTWLASRRLPPPLIDRALEPSLIPYNLLVGSLVAVAKGGKLVWSTPSTWFEEKLEKHRYVYLEFLRRRILYRSIFAWAIERAKERYRTQAHRSEAAGERATEVEPAPAGVERTAAAVRGR